MTQLALFDVKDLLTKDSIDISEYCAESIRNIYGVSIEFSMSDYAGMTAQETAEAALVANGMQKDDADEKLPRLMEDLFYTYYNVAGHEKQLIVDGADELLKELKSKGAVIGIATGEIEKIARFRLEKAGLSEYFSFGAFGNEARDANGIVEAALQKAGAEFGTGSGGLMVCTCPSFIVAAKSKGMKCVGVASGAFAKEALADAGADLAVESLKDRGKIAKLVS